MREVYRLDYDWRGPALRHTVTNASVRSLGSRIGGDRLGVRLQLFNAAVCVLALHLIEVDRLVRPAGHAPHFAGLLVQQKRLLFRERSMPSGFSSRKSHFAQTPDGNE